MFNRFLIVTLTLALFVTCLTPFSVAVAMEKDVQKQQEKLSYAEIEKKIIEKEMQKIDLNEVDQFKVFGNFEEPKNESVLLSGDVTTQAEKWKTILTASRTIKKADFYISAGTLFLLTVWLGWGRVTLSLIAGVLGVAISAVPNALPGEKIHVIKKMKWVDRKKYIYDIQTTEYIKRGKKKATINKKTIRENGWGND
ncbi:hypothetical protein [Bacillus pumilus]|uniref:hypothetical protein n=1 Tax=Bacillus pumilus TaxID=1408 RepID=UPI0011A3D322|nr:hypothetical protein [Bacillus pumilus]